MTRRKITSGSIGTDVDPDTEEVHLADGRRLSEQVAEEMAERALARHRGRPSVTGEKARTPIELRMTAGGPDPKTATVEAMTTIINSRTGH